MLDGFVTEHIEIKKDVSKLYKCLSEIENNVQRRFLMLEKRKTELEAIIAEINT